MAQSAEDLARESIESYNAGDFDRLRSLLADDFYEEELGTQRRIDGADARVEAAQAWKRAFPDEQATITGVTTGGTPWPSRSPGRARRAARSRRPTVGVAALEQAHHAQGGRGDRCRGREAEGAPPLLRSDDAPPADRSDGPRRCSYRQQAPQSKRRLEAALGTVSLLAAAWRTSPACCVCPRSRTGG